ncbi:MAG: endo-1,4-beta-xylanase [Ignavibacteriae bacterium]|nr:endo-1,4-beta-xylanase [Ignavibacteriota bacterium]
MMRDRVLLTVLLLTWATCLLFEQSSAQPLAQGQKKYLGNVISNGFNIRSDFQNYWNQVTPENAGKWGSVEGSPGSYNWTELDNIYNYAVSRSFRYRHHTLIWGAQQPSFMSGLDSAQQYERIESWIRESGLRYLSASFVDVVNEPLHQPPAYRNALGGSGATGWDWVIRAFQLARLHWRFTKLHLNDYGIINDGNATTQYLQIINLLKDRGLIDGIGVQGHRFEIESAAPTTLRSNLDRLAATGLPIFMTEVDLGNLGNSGTPNDSVQLSLYQQRFSILWEHPGVQGITLWGYVQGLMWQATCYLVRSNGTERPALEWLRLYVKTPLPPGIVSPNGTTGEPRNPLLVWNSSLLATSYRVQVATDRNFTSVVVDTVTADTVCRPSPLAASTTLFWRVSARNLYGASSYYFLGSFATGTQIVAAPELTEVPSRFELMQNYPNPFNPTTTIRFIIPVGTGPAGTTLAGRHAPSLLKVYDLLGKEVATLVNEELKPGSYERVFDASDLSSGVYLYQLRVGNLVHTRKLILLR